MPPRKPTDEEQLLSGPQVARKAIPKSMQTRGGQEDSLGKRIFFYVSGRAFVGGANVAFIALVLGVIFAILVTVKGFMCPDISYAGTSTPTFCPQKQATQPQP